MTPRFQATAQLYSDDLIVDKLCTYAKESADGAIERAHTVSGLKPKARPPIHPEDGVMADANKRSWHAQCLISGEQGHPEHPRIAQRGIARG